MIKVQLSSSFIIVSFGRGGLKIPNFGPNGLKIPNFGGEPSVKTQNWSQPSGHKNATSAQE